MAVRSKSSKAWLHEHVNDHYVHMAQKDGYRARAAYKLLEINEKDKLIKPGTVLADLGSAPGSWSQVAAKLTGTSGAVFALDILPMEAIGGVSFIQGDFRENDVLAQFETLLDNRPLDLVICDMHTAQYVGKRRKRSGTQLLSVRTGFRLRLATPENRRQLFGQSLSGCRLSGIHGSHARNFRHGADAQTRSLAQSLQ